MIMCNGSESAVNYCSSILIILKCQRAVTGLKADVVSHLDTAKYVTQHRYWLIMIHGHKLSYCWPPYIAASSEVPRICWNNLEEFSITRMHKFSK